MKRFGKHNLQWATYLDGVKTSETEVRRVIYEEYGKYYVHSYGQYIEVYQKDDAFYRDFYIGSIRHSKIGNVPVEWK